MMASRTVTSRGAAALVLALAVPPGAEAVCTAGAFLLRVPEDCTTIAAAVTAAGNGATIDIAAGTYSFAAGPLSLSAKSKNLTLAARQLRAVTFSGGGASGVVEIVNATDGSNGRPIVFEGIRFVDGTHSTVNRAAGVSLLSAEATFVDCDFVDNEHTGTAGGGGGLGLYGGSRAIVVRSIFDGNRAKSQGAGIYVVSSATRGDSSVWVIGSSFVDNSTAESGFSGNAAGGALYARDAAVRVADTEFRNNRAGFAGGALYAFGNWTASAPYCNFGDATADVLLTHVALIGNTADDSANPSAAPQTFGGAMHIEGCVRARLYASLVEDNEADWGGALSADHARLELRQSVLRGNRSTVSDNGAFPIGGAVTATSSDNTGLAENRPSSTIVVDHTLFHGALDGSPVSQFGGCLNVGGDTPRWQLNGVQTGYRAPFDLTDSILFECVVDYALGATVARGGGVETRLADLTWDQVLLARNRADGTGAADGYGGGVSLWNDTESSWSDVVFSGNAAEQSDPDIFLENAGSTPSGSWDAWTETSVSPLGGILIAAPSSIPAGGFPFDGEAWLGFGWSGAAATLDGELLGLSPKNGLVAAAPGAHTLAVTGLGACARCAASVSAPPAPFAELSVTPASITTAQSSTLAWQTTLSAGSFLTSVVDRGVGEDSTSSGSVSVSPDGSTTYRYLAFTTEGGALAERRLFVSEAAGAAGIFGSDFELDFYGWSNVAQ